MWNAGRIAKSGRALGLLVWLTALSGCASFPSSGPTVGRIEKMAEAESNRLGYEIVSITPETLPSERIDTSDRAAFAAMSATTQPRSEIIRSGDTLALGIYEVGITLFGAGVGVGSAASPPTANVQAMSVQVDEEGYVSVPYIGRLSVVGSTPNDLARYIETQLRQFSQSPQVTVAITETLENTAYVSGSAVRPGRYRLTSARERLLDVVALAGGASINADDAELRLVRDDKAVLLRLGDLQPDDPRNLVVAPGDRIVLLKRPQTFTVFGATDRVSQVPFDGRRLTLAEAVARAGGPSDQRANPTGVFLFRFEHAGEGKPDKPVIYRLNLMDPASYFLSQRFAMRDKDVIFFANAETNPPAKFIGLLNQLFNPFITAKVLTE